MTPYERVMTALSHRNPDRPPINYIATPELNTKLKAHLGIADQEALLQFRGIRWSNRVTPLSIGINFNINNVTSN